ncbi:3D domain-containing protein [Bdellovibrio sp. HCB337]|uniref:3D domain-containing protein n=1 Tax=Bdellovibrio sp. HCB337 TaxID=3394358 RepID=UPI0039A566EC
MTKKYVLSFSSKVALSFFFVAFSEICIGKLCAPGIATTSTYYTPDVMKMCNSATPCKAFKKAVYWQGSGSLPGNKIYRHTGHIESIGSCKTSIGSAGTCLIPYISVAADPKYYDPGDIIRMPALKGKIMNLPGGGTMVHPGFLIVQDGGGYIKGRNRFDFYTGSLGLMEPKKPGQKKAKVVYENSFGYGAPKDVRMVDTRECGENKAFHVIRRGYVGYEASLAAIDDALRDADQSTRTFIASLSGQRSPAGGSR